MTNFLNVYQNHYSVAAEECARYIFDSEDLQISYQEHIIDGNDPRDHILYNAAVILGKTNDFQVDVKEFQNER